MTKGKSDGTSRVFLVFEIEDEQGPAPCLRVVVSIAGREGTYSREWPTIQGTLNHNQVMDVQAFLATTLNGAIMRWTGIQGVLPME